MGQIVSLRNEIEAIITAMADCDYLRASFREANTKLAKQKITNCLAIHTDQTEVTGVYTPGYIYKTIPIEILFVYKNSKIDDKLYNVDSLVDTAEDKADEFHDKLIRSAVIDDVPEFDDYTLARLEAFKRFDTIVTGVLYQWTAPVSRNQFYCS
jgi:hypothetical protein